MAILFTISLTESHEGIQNWAGREELFCLYVAIVGRAKYTRARAKFRGDATRGERHTIAIAKIRDYSQSNPLSKRRQLFCVAFMVIK